jgi:hypothetical protein
MVHTQWRFPAAFLAGSVLAVCMPGTLGMTPLEKPRTREAAPEDQLLLDPLPVNGRPLPKMAGKYLKLAESSPKLAENFPKTAEDYLRLNALIMGAEPSPRSCIRFWFFRMRRGGCEAATPSGGILYESLAFLRSASSLSPGTVVVSANLRDEEGHLAFPEYTVVERDGVRFGVTGITQEPSLKHGVGPWGVGFGDIPRDLERVLPVLRKQCDIVVLLAFADVYNLDPRVLSGADIVVVPSRMPRSGPLRRGSVEFVPSVAAGLDNEIYLGLDDWLLASRAGLH